MRYSVTTNGQTHTSAVWSDVKPFAIGYLSAVANRTGGMGAVLARHAASEVASWKASDVENGTHEIASGVTIRAAEGYNEFRARLDRAGIAWS
jgi:hypothetical protein